MSATAPQSHAGPTEAPPLFYEVQHPPTWARWLFAIATMPAVVVILVVLVLSPRTGGSTWPQTIALGVFASFILSLTLLISRLSLTIAVNPRHIRASLTPIWRTTIPFARIDRCEVIDSWAGMSSVGLHWVPRTGWVYSMGARRALRISLRSGRRVLLCTPRADDLLAAIYLAAGGDSHPAPSPPAQ
ncbi:MAG: hypothetical protein KF745_14865 [Phycisphaeraceae bacterium]|nr:hypothetical protein [Phycisphaeraceae bacterium]